MRISATHRCLIVVTLLLASVARGQDARPAGALRLPLLFGSGMVIQRDAAVPVWGWSAPGASIRVSLDAQSRATTAGSDGAWKVAFAPLPAGGPHRLIVRSAADSLVIGDILAGDVWVASGQSNMEFVVSNVNGAAAEIAAAHDPNIRHFKVPTSFAPAPDADLAGGEWASADPQHVGTFSAVPYFFARDLRKSVDVPIGIVNTSWGGSRIEPWMSREALGLDEAAWRRLWDEEQRSQQRLIETMRAKIGDLPTVDSGLVQGRAAWADPALDESRWQPIAVPSLWEQAGYPDMDGIAWYRASFDLTADEAARGVKLGLGAIDDADISWVNGVEIGRTNNYSTARVYDVPASALRAGRNVIAVRVDDTGGGGGIYGDPSALFLEVGGTRRPLAAQWKFRVGAISLQADGQHINKVPTVLYNKMVHPLLPFPITGVLWYQGESNADSVADAVRYRALFATMITSWRRAWGMGSVPFLWVQLANYMAPDSQPAAQSAWAALRDAQSAALALPKTAQAVIIDIGDEKDIHPRNKQDVGHRLALAARRVAYRQRVEDVGPTHRSHGVRGGTVIVRFDHAAGGLVSRSPGGAVGGFAIAGADRHFVWADARIEGSSVIVSSPRVASPVAVRYGWGNNPTEARLYNGEGLPAVPFRTDGW
ncbi:MAG TPA: sialate O-acetylesterase [Gemmatimonadaceae bacterium]|nr:sialate O-acetylesterase [Gemmatimonadaceae bacterium]